MNLKSVLRRVKGALRQPQVDARRVNTVNNPAYSSTVVDESTGRRTVMGTGRKGACAVMRDTSLKPGAPRTAVVLGVARGGTSMVSGVLRGLGLYMGDDLGFNHEDTKVQRIVNNKNFADFADLAKSRDAAHPLWGFKFPEASLVMDKFHPSLRNPHYLFVIRHPLSRGMSVVARTGGTLSAAIQEALKSYQSIFTFLETVDAPVLLINYEQATENPQACVAQIAAFLGLGDDEEAIGRAAAMISGEGAGYLNLPEFWFFAEETGAPAAGTPVTATPGSLKKGEVTYARERASVWSAPEGGFPKTFRLSFTLKGAQDDDRVRIYYDYDGQFHLGHRLLLSLTSDTPELAVQTTGALKRLAIVPLAETGSVSDVAISADDPPEPPAS